MIDAVSKICTKCRIELPLADYYSRAYECKTCFKERQRQISERTDPEERRRRHKAYYQANKEKVIQSSNAWRRNNRERRNETSRSRSAERRKTDVQWKLSMVLRCRFSAAIRGNYKSGSAVNDLGCSVEFFKQYLESMFYANPETGEVMSWDNHTKYGWHIDHKRPLSSFDLTDRTQALQALHYTNLQPLWWRENLIKGYKTIEEAQ